MLIHGSGYTQCPCCGYDTVSSDVCEPELCSECEESGCELDGSNPLCTYLECERWNEDETNDNQETDK